MSEIADLIDSVIGQGLAPHLRSRRFKKHARTFTLDTGACTHVVNVQGSRSNEGGEGRFTLNLGVYFPRIAERRGIVAKGAYPKEYDSTVHSRIGSLMPDRTDLWWEIRGGTDLRALADEIVRVYALYGEPWLRELTDLENVIARMREGDGLIAAAAALELGRPEQANEIVNEVRREAKPVFVPVVRRFAERNGLVLAAADSGTLEP